VVLDKSITKTDMKKIADGLTLDDGPVTVDKISYVSDSSSRKELGIELHSGKNRIVRRIFESQGYKVQKLDRVIFAGLTKKDIPRGKWRYLTDKEVNYLKML
jgi:23S rRNA pseudouridine2605 synthase